MGSAESVTGDHGDHEAPDRARTQRGRNLPSFKPHMKSVEDEVKQLHQQHGGGFDFEFLKEASSFDVNLLSV